MAKKRRRKTHSNFHVKALQSFQKKDKKATPDGILLANMQDPRMTRPDGGRVRPVFYDDGYRMTFEPTR